MSPDADRPSRYSDQEVALILRRAAEMQAGARGSVETADGLSLAALEEIAREAGIDPSLVRRAALEVEDRRAAAPHNAALGAPSRLIIERRLTSEPTAHDYEMLAAELRRALTPTGHVEIVGRSFGWSSGRFGETDRQVAVTVTPRARGAVLRIEESLGPLAGGVFGGIVGGVGGGGFGVALGVGLGVLASPVLAVGGAAVCVVGSYALARSIFGSVATRRGAALRELADRLLEVLEAESGRLTR